jgi:hypothetical protein
VLFARRQRRLWVGSGPLAGRPVATSVRRGAVTLRPGDGIPAGGHVRAGASRLAMRTDGDLVLTHRGRVRWRARTAGHPGAYLRLRPDGAAVVHSLHHDVLWSSPTKGHRGSRLHLRAGDGRLTLRSARGTTVWSPR